MINDTIIIQDSIEHFNDKKIREKLFFGLIRDKIKNTRNLSVECWKIIKDEPSNLSEFTWDWMKEIYKKCPDNTSKEYAAYLFSTILSEYTTNDVYADITSKIGTSYIGGAILQQLFDDDKTPYNVILNTQTAKNNLSQSSDCNTMFLHGLLTQFMQEQTHMVRGCNTFLNDFVKSTGLTEVISLSDFTMNIFQKQYDYFHGITNGITLLKNFYIMLLTIEPNLFDVNDGLTISYLKNQSFSKYFSQGYKLIYYNPFDPLSVEDKVILIPNGDEKKSSKMKKNTLVPVDFTIFDSPTVRYAFKHWFWNDPVNLLSKKEQLAIGKYFIDYLNKISALDSTKSDQLDINTSIFSVISYSSHINTNQMQPSYINNVVKQLKYFTKNNLLKINPDVLYYFEYEKKPKISNSLVIPEEHSFEIAKELNKGITVKDQLLSYAFLITISTELRPSEVFSINRYQLDTDKNGNNIIRIHQKQTGHKEPDIPITPLIRRSLEACINLTKSYSYTCNEPDISNSIFLYEASKNKFRVLTTGALSAKLKKTCQKLNLPEYTSENLRDTFMTNVIEYAIKNGLSLFEIKAVVRHKSINTTIQNYSSLAIRNYLETTYNALAEDLVLNGTIVNPNDPDVKEENEVDDGCGYCPLDVCIIKNGLSCAMCDGFKTTIDRIPYFERKIETIDKGILDCNLKHDKEHQLAIKKLYIAYLEKLMIKAEEVENVS